MQRSRQRTTVLLGTVVAGLGKAGHYIAKAHYRKQFRRKLGIDPYRGTLNLALKPLYARRLSQIKRGRHILVRGLARSGKVLLGDVLCYRAMVMGHKCVLIIPKLTRHKNVAEIISEKRLRDRLSLRDGSLVKVYVST